MSLAMTSPFRRSGLEKEFRWVGGGGESVWIVKMLMHWAVGLTVITLFAMFFYWRKFFRVYMFVRVDFLRKRRPLSLAIVAPGEAYSLLHQPSFVSLQNPSVINSSYLPSWPSG